MSISRILPAAALTLAGTCGSAHATTYSKPGWVESHFVAGGSASTTMAGQDYAVGYAALARFGAANWDVAADTFTRSCNIITCPDFLFVGHGSYNIFTGKTTFHTPDTGKEARMGTELQVPVTLMGESMMLFRLEAEARGASFAADTVSYGVWLVDTKVLGGSKNLPWTTRVVQHCGTIAEADADFTIASIPVTVAIESEGCVYVDASVTWTNDSVLSGSITPGSSVDATLSAGVGVSGYSAGVYGTATIFDASVPFSLDNKVTSTGGTVSGNVRATVTGLDGEFGLYLDFFGDRVATQELFDWTGMTYLNQTIVTLPIASSP